MEKQNETRKSRRARSFLRFARCVFLMLLAFIAAAALLGLLSRDRAFSEDENRSLAQRPALTAASLADGSFFANASDYLSDQFPGRDRWIALDTYAALRLGRKDVNGVMIGSDNYLFTPPETPDPARNEEKIAAVNDFAVRNENLNIVFMLVPGAAAVLTDKLPANAPLRDQLADIRAVTDALSGEITVVDAAAALHAHSQEYIYYRTDHHWTTDGAYYAFLAAQTALCGNAAPPAFSASVAAEGFEGTLASRAGIHSGSDTITVYLPDESAPAYYVYYPDTRERVTSVYKASALEEKDKYTVFFGGNHALLEICTTANTGRNLIVFKDSYANCFVPFLTGSFDRIILIDPRYYYDELSTVMTAYDITDVLFLYSADTWMTDAALPDVLATG